MQTKLFCEYYREEVVNRTKRRKETTAKLGVFGEPLAPTVSIHGVKEKSWKPTSLSIGPSYLFTSSHFGRVPLKFLLLSKFSKVKYQS